MFRASSLLLLLGLPLAGAVGGCASCVPGPTCTPEDPDRYEDNLIRRGRLGVSTFLESLEVQAYSRDRVLFCTGVQGMHVVDASDPTVPVTAGEVTSSLSDPQFPRCQHVALAGNVAYFTNRGDEVQPRAFVAAVDLSEDPPEEVAVFARDDRSFEGIAARDDLVFLAQHTDGVGVLRRGPTGFVELGELTDVENAWHVALDGDLLFVADGRGGLVTASIVDPTDPSVVGRAAIDGAAQYVDLDIERGLAFVAAGAEGVFVFDVADPAAPLELARIDTPGSALQVGHADTSLVVADWNDVRVYDVSDPTAPAHLAIEQPETTASFPRVLGAAVLDELVFVGEWTGFHTYELFPERQAPALHVERTETSFGTVAVGDRAARAVLLANHGNAPLHLEAVTATPSIFTIDGFEPVTLAPGERTSVDVIVEPSDVFEHRGAVEVCSDDADEPKRPINLVVNRVGSGVGQPAPETEVELLSGDTLRLSEQRGNVVVLAYFATF